MLFFILVIIIIITIIVSLRVPVQIYIARGTKITLQMKIKVANTHKPSLQQMCLYFCHPVSRENQMQNIWNKADPYQLNQSKALTLRTTNVSLSVLGKNNIATLLLRGSEVTLHLQWFPFLQIFKPYV